MLPDPLNGPKLSTPAVAKTTNVKYRRRWNVGELNQRDSDVKSSDIGSHTAGHVISFGQEGATSVMALRLSRSWRRRRFPSFAAALLG